MQPGSDAIIEFSQLWAFFGGMIFSGMETTSSTCVMFSGATKQYAVHL